MAKLFGTDGIRGVVGRELSAEFALKLGKSIATVMLEKLRKVPTIFIGKDTRGSGDMLEAGVAAGLMSLGVNVEMLGVVPTPALAYLVRRYQVDAGIMISASHNPFEYNGFKIFSGDGFKLPDAYEEAIEERMYSREPFFQIEAQHTGRCKQNPLAIEDYIDFVLATCDVSLKGIKVMLDCANGSAGVTASRIFSALGADVRILSNTPDGQNINRECGSTHMRDFARLVRRERFDVGFAFDGDADRVLAVDKYGDVVTGDQILAILADAYHKAGELTEDTFVGTVMSNLGLHLFAEEYELKLATTAVGDRYVLEEMEKSGYKLGGEQSGHVILRDHQTTGDGQLVAVKILSIMAEEGETLNGLASVMQVMPQMLKNVPATTEQKERFASNGKVNEAIEKWTETLGKEGRILIRPSGTEPLVRVMVEAADEEILQTCIDELVSVVKESMEEE